MTRVAANKQVETSVLGTSEKRQVGVSGQENEGSCVLSGFLTDWLCDLAGSWWGWNKRCQIVLNLDPGSYIEEVAGWGAFPPASGARSYLEKTE